MSAEPQTTALAATSPKQKMDVLRDLLERSKASMAMVVPKHVTPDRLVKLALVAASRTPLLLQCDPKSIVQGVMTAAQLGLDCGGVLGSAYLVPYKNNKTGRYEAQLILGYRGLVDLARRSGEIETIEAHVVCEKDSFEIAFGLDTVLKHVPCLQGDPGPLVVVYAIARLKDGGRQVEVMTKAQVEDIRKRSRAGNSGPWITDPHEMARKTVVRRLCKYLPLSPELAQAMTVEDKVEGNVSSIDLVQAAPAPQLEEAPEEDAAAEGEPEPPATKSSALAAKLKAPKAEAVREPGIEG